MDEISALHEVHIKDTQKNILKYSRASLVWASINRASHRNAVPLHFQCAGGVVSG
jgi:hypothetical protein